MVSNGIELITTCKTDINTDSETPQRPPDVSVFTSLSVFTFPAVQGHSAGRKTQPPNWKQLPCYTTTVRPPLVYLLLPAHVHIFSFVLFLFPHIIVQQACVGLLLEGFDPPLGFRKYTPQLFLLLPPTLAPTSLSP